MPRTFVLPEEAAEYEEHMREAHAEGQGGVWIMKPSLGARGNGIFLHRHHYDYDYDYCCYCYGYCYCYNKYCYCYCYCCYYYYPYSLYPLYLPYLL